MHLFTLAQSVQQVADRVPEGWVNWLTKEPLGQIVGVGALVVIGLIALYLVLITFNTLRVHAKKLMIAGALVGGGIWAANFFEPDWMTWVIIGFIAFGGFVGYALMLTHAK